MSHRQNQISRRLLLLGMTLCCVVFAGCARHGTPAPTVRIFHAAGLAPYLLTIPDASEKDLHISLKTEGGGSMEECRKVTELGRSCDVLMLADEKLVKTQLAGMCSWRLDFAADQLVLGVGVRAPDVARAEKDWPAVVLQPAVRLGRVNEKLAPIGYRTLLALKLQEQLDHHPLYERYLLKCPMVVDDVERLAPWLKNGEIDYAILYRSTCIAHGIRYIALDPRVNLSSPAIDYSKAHVSYDKLKSGQKETVSMQGSPILWTMTMPRVSEQPTLAIKFMQYLLAKQLGKLADSGMTTLPRPLFYGSREDYSPFSTLAQYGGPLP